MDTNVELQNAVESFANGKKESFDQIYELSYRYLHTCVIHVVKDENIAMDILQDTYLEVSKSIVQLKNKEGFLNWTATIANRKCYAYLKKQKDVLLYVDSEDEGSDDFFENIADNEEFIPETVLQNKAKQRLIREIIYGLTDIQRLCVIGFFYNEQKQDEIAKELGIPVNTVKSHLNRAKAKIKEAVVELDVKKGTRLYSMSPFMLLFFKEEVRACVLKPMTTALALKVGTSTTKRSISGVVKGVSAKAKPILSKSVTAVKVKVAVGVTAGAVTVGGVAVGLSLPDQTVQIYEDGSYEQSSDSDDEWEVILKEKEQYPGFNGDYYEGTLRDINQKYMTYEDLEPTVMYVINIDDAGICYVYNDPNVTDGILMMGGIVEANDEITIDGKGTYDGIEYYRIAYKEETMLDFQLIIPAEYLSAEK